MIDADAFTLEELVEAAATELARLGLSGAAPDGRVSPLPDQRTIRYYATLGLVDRPRIEGRTARYGRRHLVQLLAIKALQAEGLGLAEVQARLHGRTAAELEALVAAAAAAVGPLPARSRLARPVAWRELAVEPGLRVQVAEGYRPGDVRALAARIAAALDALAALETQDGSPDTTSHDSKEDC